MLSVICSKYNIKSGKVTIACDNSSALFNSLEASRKPKIIDAEFDLIYAIKNRVGALPISILYHHVKGHQDAVRSVEVLDRWSLLNIEMDSMAKSVVTRWTENHNLQHIEGEPWSVWSDALKLVNDLDSKLYDIMHSTEVENYWTRKGKFPEQLASHIHWEAIEKAMKTSSLARRTFITKHATGMCGVGKFMKRWGKRDTNACPRCGEPENAAHVWICPHPQADEVWSLSLKKLDDWMTQVGTLSDIRESILHHLDSWRSPDANCRSYNYSNITLSDLQGECGWQSLLEGFVTKAWADRQHAYYHMIHSSRNGKRWVTELIKKLWTVAWNQWEHRNRVLHEEGNLLSLQEMESLNNNIASAYRDFRPLLPATDQHLFGQPLQRLLNRSKRVKEAWLTQVTVAKERAVRRQRQRSSLTHMQNLLRQWLNLAR